MTTNTTDASNKTATEPSPDVPIFLRKTYHMIDTCDPTIAGWSEDGETFVVKKPDIFESKIIPQFFKHSKFSSFVRQLNFYSFRKIKYADTIRINPELEAATANFWRFRHEHFRRGRPDLLSEIKRMNGVKQQEQQKAKAPASSTPDKVNSSSVVETEVQALKARIEEMHKNIDHLTTMVEKVNLKQEETQETQAAELPHKRVKVVAPEPAASMSMDVLPEAAPSSSVSNTLERIPSSMALDDLDTLPPAQLVPLPDPAPLSNNGGLRESSSVSNETDVDFVDALLENFGDEDDMEFFQEPPKTHTTNPNAPDPELMKRLSDALAVLPRSMQEMIVERLITSITSPGFQVVAVPPEEEQVTTTPSSNSSNSSSNTPSQEDEEHAKSVAVPLAAATLAALLQHFVHSQDAVLPKNVSKILPVVPVHA